MLGVFFLWAFSRKELDLAGAGAVGRRSVRWAGTLGDGNCLLNGIALL